MSVIFNASGEAISRNSGLVAASSSYTLLFYLKMNAPGLGQYRTPFIIANSIAALTNYVAMYTDTDTLDLKLWGDNGVGTFTSIGSTLVAGEWNRIAYVRSGTSNRFYVQKPGGALTLIDTQVLSFASATFAEMMMGDDGFSEDGIQIGWCREYNLALSLQGLIDEFNSSVPSQTSGLNGDWPLTANLNDDSGAGHNWSAVGSLSFDTEPEYPANNLRTNAELISSIPFSDSQSVEVGGFPVEVWYKYVAGPENSVRFWAYGDNLTPYAVILQVYIGASTNDYIRAENNRRVQFVVTEAETYYFQLTPTPASIAPAILNLELEAGPNEAVPIGSIFVNDDTEDFPLALLSGIDGDDYHVYRLVRDFPAGEAADVLIDGTILVFDDPNNTLYIYTGQLVVVTSISPINLSSLGGCLRTCLGTNRWWIGVGANGAKYVNPDGTVGPLHTLTGYPNLTALAASNDETILYHTGAGAGNRAIKRWDLVNDVALSNLAVEVSGYLTFDILVLSDDSIIISFIKTSGGVDIKVKRYDPSGTLLNTYDFGSDFVFPSGTLPRLTYAINDPVSFWFWTHPGGSLDGTSRFQEIRVSDGVVISEINQAEYEGGVYVADETLTPLSKDGNAFSCPFLILREPIGEVTGTGTLIVRKMTVPSGSLQTFDVEVGGGLSPSTLSMQDGDEETYTEVPVGNGYSVEETVPEGWNVSYSVSNGSPINAILIEANQTTTVIIVNSTGGGGIFKIPTIPTGPPSSPPNGPNEWQSHDDFPDTGTGEITPVKIPTPFFTTGFIQDN